MLGSFNAEATNDYTSSKGTFVPYLTGIDDGPPPNSNLSPSGMYFSGSSLVTTTGGFVTNVQSSGIIVINQNFLNDIEARPTQAQDNLIFTLGHELQHDVDAAGVVLADNGIMESISSYNTVPANAGTPEDLTGLVQSYVTIQTNDEGTANMAGWNAVLSAAMSAPNAQLQANGSLTQNALTSLVQATDYAYVGNFYTLDNGVAVLKPGFALNSDGTLDLANSTNVMNADVAMLTQLTSANGLTYQGQDIANALNSFAQVEGSTPFSLNYSTLEGNVGPITDSTLLQDGFSGGTSGSATIVNSADNSTHIFNVTGDVASVDTKSVDASGNNVDNESVYGITSNQANGGSGVAATVDLNTEVINTSDSDGVLLNTTAIANTYTSPGAAVSLDTQVTVVNDYTTGISTTTTLNNNPNNQNEECTISIVSTPIGSPSTVLGQATEDTSSAGSNSIAVTGDVAVPLIPLDDAVVTVTNASAVAIPGNSNTVTLGTGDAVTLTGTDDTVSAAGGDNLTLGSGSSVVVSGSNIVVNAGSDSQTTLNGTSETVNFADNSGSSVSFSASSSDTVNGTGATVDLGYGSSLTMNLNANSSNSSVGSQDTLNTDDNHITVNGNGADLTITGSASTVTAGSDITALISRSGFTYKGGSENTLTIDGSGTVSLTANGGSMVSFGGYSSGTVTGVTDRHIGARA